MLSCVSLHNLHLDPNQFLLLQLPCTRSFLIRLVFSVSFEFSISPRRALNLSCSAACRPLRFLQRSSLWCQPVREKVAALEAKVTELNGAKVDAEKGCAELEAASRSRAEEVGGEDEWSF